MGKDTTERRVTVSDIRAIQAEARRARLWAVVAIVLGLIAVVGGVVGLAAYVFPQ